MRKFFLAVIFFWIISPCFCKASAQECREATSAEKIAIQNLVDAARQQIRQSVEKNGWIAESETTDEKVASNPGPFRPLMLCGDIYKLQLNLDPASALAQKIKDSAEYYQRLTQNQNDDKKLVFATNQMFRFAAMQKMEIDVNENDPYLHEDHPGSVIKQLNIPGTAFSYLVYRPASSNLEQPEETYYLCFGNWSNAAKYAASHSYVPFQFAHKQHGGYIENIVVKIKGDPLLANNLIKQIAWNKMNEALTK